LNSELRLAGILACRVDARTRLGVEIVEVLRKRYSETLLMRFARRSGCARQMPAGQPINLYDPHSSGAEDYRWLTTEIIKQERRT